MMRKVLVVALALSGTVGTVSNAFADSQEQCNAYRLEMIQLKDSLAQKYGDRKTLLHNKDADPAERNRLIMQYTNDPESVRFRMLIDKFRPDRRDDCGYWIEEFGPLD